MLASNTTNVINYTGDASNTLLSTVNGVVSSTTIGTLNNINLTGTTTAATITAQQVDTTGLTAVNATLTNATTSNFFADVLSAITGYISNLIFDNATGTNLTATGTASLANVIATNTISTNIEGTNATLTNATATNFFAANASLTNATISNLAVDSISVPNTLSSAANVMTSDVGGSVSTTSIINSNVIDFATTSRVLTSTVNGVVATTSFSDTFADFVCSITSNYFCDGGNTRGANMTLGTNDAFNLGFETNNVEKMTLFSLANPSIGVGPLYEDAPPFTPRRDVRPIPIDGFASEKKFKKLLMQSMMTKVGKLNLVNSWASLRILIRIKRLRRFLSFSQT
jgi:hypothetical protein